MSSTVIRDGSGTNPPPIPDDLLYAYLRQNGHVQKLPRMVAVASPAAGTDWSTTVQTAGGSGNVAWVPLAVSAKLVASATVANRAPVLTLAYSGSTVRLNGTATATTASSTSFYTWGRGMAATTVAGTGGPATALPMLTLPGSATLAVLTGNIDATDQWSQIVLYVLELTQNDSGYLTDFVQSLRDGSPYFDSFPGVDLGL